MAGQFVEWHFFDTDAEKEWREQTSADQSACQDGGQDIPGRSQVDSALSPKTRYRYALIGSIAVLCGLALYFLWQQAAPRIAAVEGDLVSLRAEVLLPQRRGGELVATATEGNSRAASFETRYLHFSASPGTAEIIRAVAPKIDARFQQRHHDFGLALPSSAEKLRITVDLAPGKNFPARGERHLIALHPQHHAERHKIGEADALTIDLWGKLSQYLLEMAISSRDIKPQWQAMTQELKTYFELENGYNRNWQREAHFLTQRHRAQRRSLIFVHELIHESEGDDRWTQPSPSAAATANPLVEFILVTHGNSKVPELLDAFEEHDVWETLTPALFHLSAGEFEEQWHAYLRMHYPIPMNRP